MANKPRRRGVIVAAAIAGVLSMSGIAYALVSDSGRDVTAQSSEGQSLTDSHEGFISEEEALTGDLAARVTAAAEEAVPGGTVVRVETDDHGAAYEAHMTDADGNPVTVKFDEELNVIATEADEHGTGRHGEGLSSEEALTGDLAAQVTAAAEEAVPGGTVVRVETDDHGAAYEAHMTDADGNPVTVKFDEDLNILTTEQGR